MLVEEPAALRLVVAEVLLPEERLVAPFWVAVLRLVRLFWSTVPAERVVEEELPALRLVVAEEVLPLERLVEALLPEERLEVLLPEERLVLPLCELELREVRSFCAKEERLEDALAERFIEAPEERLEDAFIVAPAEREGATEPDERLIEEDPRVVVWEEDDRAAEDPPERRDWASASGAATITKVMRTAAKMLIILFMALCFKVIDISSNAGKAA